MTIKIATNIVMRNGNSTWLEMQKQSNEGISNFRF